MAKDPEDRFQSAAEIETELAAIEGIEERQGTVEVENPDKPTCASIPSG